MVSQQHDKVRIRRAHLHTLYLNALTKNVKNSSGLFVGHLSK